MPRLPRYLRAAGCAISVAFFAACAGPYDAARGYGPWEGARAAAHVRAPDLTVHDILGPVSGQGMEELRRLDHQANTPATRLRRAHILVESGRHTVARTELNRLLFGDAGPSGSVEAFARYLRARSYAATNETQRARDDLAKAAQLALDSELRNRIAGEHIADRTPVAATPAAPPVGATLSRTQWDARRASPRRMVAMGRIFRLTVHHSAMLAGRDSPRATAATLRSIQKTHMVGNGWGDIGYHYLIDRGGRIWSGRSIEWQGAHAGDPERNRGNVGICLLGNFVRGRAGQQPTTAQLQSLERMVLDLGRQHGIPAQRIYTHREMRVTDCPGEHLQVAVERMRRTLVAGRPGPTGRRTE